MEKTELCKKAIEATINSYAPYSGFSVGAALQTESGKVYTGCNIENASFTPTVCAERVALFKAVSEGERKFKTIAIVGSKDGKITAASPCGVCRQALSEFCSPDFEVLVVENENSFKSFTLSELLPNSFSLD